MAGVFCWLYFSIKITTIRLQIYNVHRKLNFTIVNLFVAYFLFSCPSSRECLKSSFSTIFLFFFFWYLLIQKTSVEYQYFSLNPFSFLLSKALYLHLYILLLLEHFLLNIKCFLLLPEYFILNIKYFLLLREHFILLIEHYLLNLKHFLFNKKYFRLNKKHFSFFVKYLSLRIFFNFIIN